MKRHPTKIPGIFYRVDAQGLRRYIVRWEDSRGKDRSETLPLGSTLEDAKAHQARLRDRKSRGEELTPNKILVDQLLDEWLERRRQGISDGTILVYEWSLKHLKKEIGHMKITAVTADTIVSLREQWIKADFKKHSISKLETPLRMALKAAARDGLIASSPFDKLLHHERVHADQKEMRCLTTNEIQSLLESTDERFRTLFSTLLFTGLRISEALSLRWSQIGLNEGLLNVETGKTKAARRSVILIPALGALLRAWKLKQDPGAELVFPFPDECLRCLVR